MSNPLVSIIIPTYNRPKHLQRAIESCLHQTYKNIEIIIEHYHDDRIKYYRNSENRGSVYSRNRGLTLCKGTYVNFLDDDDELLPDKIELQVMKFFNSKVENLGVVTCDMEYRREGWEELKETHLQGNIYKKLLRQYCIFGIHCMLIKRIIVPKFDITLKSSQEYDLAIRLARGSNFDYVPKRLAITHTSQDQISYNYKKKKEGTKNLFHKYRSEFLRFGFRFYIYNWVRFHYLLFKYFISLKLGIRSINALIYKFHNILTKRV